MVASRPDAAERGAMDQRLQALAGRQHGAFSAAEAARLGVDAAELRRAVRGGSAVRVRRGAYVDSGIWRSATPNERYRLGVLAVARTRPSDVISHHAALAVHGLPLWQHDPNRIDLLAGVARGSRETASTCTLVVT